MKYWLFDSRSQGSLKWKIYCRQVYLWFLILLIHSHYCIFIKLQKSLHKKWNFLFRISSANVTKSAENYRFGYIYWRNCHCEKSPHFPAFGLNREIYFFIFSFLHRYLLQLVFPIQIGAKCSKIMTTCQFRCSKTRKVPC